MSQTETAVQRTFSMIKPDGMIIPGVKKELIIAYFNAGLDIVEARTLIPSRALLAEQYAEHEGKPWLPSTIDYVRGEGDEFHRYVSEVLSREFGKVNDYCGNFAMILEGANAIEVVRKINGPMDPDEARKTAKDSIRARFGRRHGDGLYNIVHASANPSDAKMESQLYFPNLEQRLVTLDIAY